MKINFKQPKYVIPLIILPFLIFGFFVLGGKMNADEKAVHERKVEGINTDMPGVDSSISKGEIKDKFSAYQQAFKNVTDQSAMGDMAKPESGDPDFDYSSSYTIADEQRLEAQRKMDSLNKVLQFGQNNIQGKIAEYNRSGGFDESGYTTGRNSTDDYLSDNNETEDIRLNNLLKKQQQDSKPTFNEDNENPGSYESQMRVFHEQMKYVDSMQHANGVATTNGKQEAKHNTFSKDFNPKKDTSFKPLSISSANAKGQNVFNTVRNFEDDDDNIAAMIDQDVKATLGSRVRIRLLKDMYVGDYLIKRGTYIYGVVTGFQKQRVNISIAQVLYNNTSLPVKIDLFDNDGYLGLYVPGSNFREFSKEIGTQATQGLSQVVTPDNSNVRMNMLSQLFNTTTTTLSSLIKKDKAFLKYNYIVFLKDNKISNN